MVGFYALDQVLRFFLRSVNCVTFEFDAGGNFLLYRPLNSAGLRIPLNMIPNLKITIHQVIALMFTFLALAPTILYLPIFLSCNNTSGLVHTSCTLDTLDNHSQKLKPSLKLFL